MSFNEVLHKSLLRQAIKGNIAAMKQVLELADRYNVRQEVAQGKPEPEEFDLGRVTDEELMFVIDLKRKYETTFEERHPGQLELFPEVLFR